jgi:hypothetical protein
MVAFETFNPVVSNFKVKFLRISRPVLSKIPVVLIDPPSNAVCALRAR